MNKIIQKTIFTFLVLIIGASQVFGATNILTNGSFESGTIGWTFAGDSTLVASAHYDGSYSARLDITSTISQAISAYVSTISSFQLRYAGHLDSTLALIVNFYWVDVYGNPGFNSERVDNAENTWKLLSLSMSGTLSSAAYRLTSISIFGNYPSNYIYVDAVKLYRTTGGGGGGGDCSVIRGGPPVLC